MNEENKQEIDYDKLYSDSFVKKIPFPTMKYEVCKASPGQDNHIFTLATATLHKSSKFKLFTSKETKQRLTPIVSALKQEAEDNYEVRKAERIQKAKEDYLKAKQTAECMKQDVPPEPEYKDEDFEEEDADFIEKALQQISSEGPLKEAENSKEEGKEAPPQSSSKMPELTMDKAKNSVNK